MQKFCPKCGAKIAADIKFCPKCGSSIDDAEINKSMNKPVYRQQKIKPAENSSSVSGRTLFIGAGIAVLIVIALVGGMKNIFGANDDKAAVGKSAIVQETSSITSSEDAVRQDDSSLKQAKDVLATIGIDTKIIGKVIAVSRIDDNGFFAVAENNAGKKQFILYAKASNTAALADYDEDLLDPGANSNSRDKALVFDMRILNDDKAGKDAAMGYWNGDDHILPLKVYTELKGQTLTPIGIYSHPGKNSPDFSSVLYEQKNVDLVNALLLHADSLKTDMHSRNINE